MIPDVFNVAVKEYFVVLVLVSEVDLVADARTETCHVVNLISDIVVRKYCPRRVLQELLAYNQVWVLVEHCLLVMVDLCLNITSLQKRVVEERGV